MENQKKGVRSMRAVYIKRRIVAVIAIIAAVLGIAKFTMWAMHEEPLNCGVGYTRALKGENWWHIAERVCPKEQDRLGEVVYWMIEVNFRGHPKPGQLIAIPNGEE